LRRTDVGQARLDATSGPTLKDVAPAVFLPPGLFAIGQGAIAPVVVISAIERGATPAGAALVVAAAGLGQIVADLPAGAVVHRYGERPAMIGASGLVVLALLGCIFAPNLAVFTFAMFLTGGATAVWLLARQAYVTAVIPFRLRARALSTLGGVFRIGLFIGPFLGSSVVALTGLWGAYALHILMAVVAAIVLIFMKDLSDKDNRSTTPKSGALWTVAREERPVLATLGVGVLVVSAIRTTRQVAIPLWGDHIGLSPTTISLIFGISGAVDMLLFYPAGKVMDRCGRLWIAVPSVLFLGASLILVPITTSAAGLIVVSLLMGAGNGMSSGIVMTLGADVAPPAHRAVFFGIWRLFSDIGSGAGPLIIASTTAAASLGAGFITMGTIGVLGAGWLGYWIPRRGQPRFQ
jgi:MFS family permease